MTNPYAILDSQDHALSLLDLDHIDQLILTDLRSGALQPCSAALDSAIEYRNGLAEYVHAACVYAWVASNCKQPFAKLIALA